MSKDRLCTGECVYSGLDCIGAVSDTSTLVLQRMVQLSVKQYLYNVCLNVLYVSLMAALIPTLVYFQMEEGWVRFLSIIFCCVVCSSLSIYFVGCSISERKFITDRVRVMKKRIIG